MKKIYDTFAFTNKKKQMDFYIKSANRGNEFAQNNLGILYENKKDYKSASRWKYSQNK